MAASPSMTAAVSPPQNTIVAAAAARELRAERGDEPAADDGQHAGNAVDSRFAVPGAVGKARTHGHHESNVGGGERQLKTGRRCNQNGGKNQIDGGADIVKRQRNRAFSCGAGTKRLAMPRCRNPGMIWLMTEPMPTAARTIMRPGSEAPNCSCSPV